jgi:hypothetical protein
MRLLQIGAGGEHLFPRTGQDQCAQIGRFRRLRRHVGQRPQHRTGQRIGLVGPVQHHRPERPVAVDANHAVSPRVARISGERSEISSPRCMSDSAEHIQDSATAGHSGGM